MGVFKKYVDTKSVTNCAFVLDVMVINTVLGANICVMSMSICSVSGCNLSRYVCI